MTKTGYCNICGCRGPLTADHVPPKGVSGLREAELKTLIRYLSLDTRRPKMCQNGVKFPTLCGECNNERLGRQYDPALIELSKAVSRMIRVYESGLIALPREIRIGTRVQRVARAIVGHLLAVLPEEQAGEPPVRAPFPDAMRDYFLDPSKPLPREISMYYWIYPSETQIVARGFSVSDARSPAWILGDMIKFFPLGYWVIWDQPPKVQVALPALIWYRARGIDEKEDLSIRLHHVPPLGWPERPGVWGMHLFNEEMTFVAYPRKRRRKRVLS